LRTSLIGIPILCSVIAFSARAQTPAFTAASVVNAASMAAGPIAPGMVAAITGSNLGDPNFFRTCAGSYPITTTCFGISVRVNGTAAPVMNDSARQVTFQVPFTVSGASATLQVTSSLSGSTLSSAVITVPVAATAPGLYSISGTGSGTGYYYVSGSLFTDVSTAVHAGDTVVMYGTGFGATNPAVLAGSLGPNTPAMAVASTTLTINSQSVPATFAGLEPGNLAGAVAGYDEAIFTVPSGLGIPAGQTQATFPVVVTVGGTASNSVNLIVAGPLPSIASITPSPVPLSASSQTVLLNGSGFESGAGLTVVLDGPGGQMKLTAPNVTFVSSSQLSIQITVGTVAGTWSATVVNPDGGESDNFVFTASGTGPTPLITSVVTTSSEAARIAQNTWIEIHGANLSQTTMDWSSWDFTKGLPYTLGGVSATVNGKAAAIYYVSPTQVNVLTPLDSAAGSVPVQLGTPYGHTAVQTATETQTSPAFLVIDAFGHVAARHLDYSLLGPASLSIPGYTFTPATPGETVLLYATGFGQTNPPITDQLAGLGPLPGLPAVTIGGTPASVAFAGLSGTGLYQFNVTVPVGTPDGDISLSALYTGSSTQSNVVITVHH